MKTIKLIGQWFYRPKVDFFMRPMFQCRSFVSSKWTIRDQSLVSINQELRGADGSKSDCLQISRTMASRINIPAEIKNTGEIDVTKSKNWLPRVKYMSTRKDWTSEVVGTPDDFSDFRFSSRNFEQGWTVNHFVIRHEISWAYNCTIVQQILFYTKSQNREYL